MENLAKAVIALMQEVQGMEKKSRVGKGDYAYDGTRDMDVKEVFNEAMANNGLCILPIGIEDDVKIDRWDQEYNGKVTQKQSVFTKVITKYLLLHTSGESQVLSGYGHGVDTQDKGAGKATTYALKNCLLLMGLTPVGKMPDTDTIHSDDIPTPKQDKKVEAETESKVEDKDVLKRKLELIAEIKARILSDTNNDIVGAQEVLEANTGGKVKSTKQLEKWAYRDVLELHSKILTLEM